MNRRSFLAAIPAAVAALAGTKVAAQTPPVASAVVYEVPPGSYVTPAMSWRGAVSVWGADTGPEVLHFPADGVIYGQYFIVADEDIGTWIVSNEVLQALAEIEVAAADTAATIAEVTDSIDALIEALDA